MEEHLPPEALQRVALLGIRMIGEQQRLLQLGTITELEASLLAGGDWEQSVAGLRAQRTYIAEGAAAYSQLLSTLDEIIEICGTVG
jgi:hypothetical protein